MKPIQVSIVHPVQLFNRETSIKGLRFNLIYGNNADLYGIDIGLVNRTSGITKGFQYGLVGLAANSRDA